MNKILIFSGTTEGRMLAQTLSENGIHCIVSVATEYGESVMPEMEGVTVHKGRMDLEKMQKFIAQSEVAAVVDATHPFATAVSENIRESLRNTEIPYIRLQRETSDIALNKDTIQENRSDVILCSDATECADFLSSTDGNILLTTGSKDLATYSRKEALKDRLFVRVLPGLESLSLCEKNGICGKNKSSRGGRNHCLCDRQSRKTKQWGFFCTGVQKNFRNHGKNNKKPDRPHRNRYGK